MRRFLLCSVLLLTLSQMLAACAPGAAPPSAGPTTWLDKPLDGASLPLGPTEILAHASDSDGVEHFEIFINDTLLAQVKAVASVPVDLYSTGYSAGGGYLASATVGWNPTTPGVYTVRVVAADTKGNVGSDATSVVTVGQVQTPSPTASVPPETPPVEPQGEVQIDFTADRTNVVRGECALLLWTVQGGEAVVLQGEPVPFSGEREVCPPETTQYTLAVYVGEGPPSPAVAERELVITVGEPQPVTPSPTHAAPTGTSVLPTATAVPPASTPTTPAPPPTIVSIQANPSSITQGQCTTVSWAVEGVISAVYFDGQGVGDHDSRQKCPGQTATYTLRAVGPGGEDTANVTVTVTQPQPTQTQAFSADLAITDLYPETNYGPVWTRITNHGPGTANNVTVQLSCQWAQVDPIEGTTVDTDQMGPMPIFVGSLSPGQTQAFNADIDVVPGYRYDMTCTIQVPFNDPNPGNNSYSESFP